jgi:acetyltransferase-like isoleucine patch superfamily enzyme
MHKVIEFIKRKIKVQILHYLKPIFDELSLTTYRVYGSQKRLNIHSNAKVANSLFNTFSGNIKIDEYAFTGHNVSFLTGSHNYNLCNEERMVEIPLDGNDIHVKKGSWIGSNSTIIGPCIIGENAVIAAGSIVTKDVDPNCIVGGCPAKLIKRIDIYKSS